MLGTFEAGYGIVQYLTGYQKIFGLTKQFYTEEATGTYINHNHFAGSAGACDPFCGDDGLLQPAIPARPRGAEKWRGRPGRTGFDPRIFFYAFIVILLLVGVVFSRSRMGIFRY